MRRLDLQEKDLNALRAAADIYSGRLLLKAWFWLAVIFVGFPAVLSLFR